MESMIVASFSMAETALREAESCNTQNPADALVQSGTTLLVVVTTASASVFSRKPLIRKRCNSSGGHKERPLHPPGCVVHHFHLFGGTEADNTHMKIWQTHSLHTSISDMLSE